MIDSPQSTTATTQTRPLVFAVQIADGTIVPFDTDLRVDVDSSVVAFDSLASVSEVVLRLEDEYSVRSQLYPITIEHVADLMEIIALLISEFEFADEWLQTASPQMKLNSAIHERQDLLASYWHVVAKLDPVDDDE